MVSLGILRPLASWGYYAMPQGALFYVSGFPVISPGERTYGSALLRSYLERCSVHACIQLCTRVYTVVYTRVYFSLLGSRYIPRKSMPSVEMFLSSVYAPRLHCPRPLVISCLSRGGFLLIAYTLPPLL